VGLFTFVTFNYPAYMRFTPSDSE